MHGSRRSVLQATAIVATAALAGCTDEETPVESHANDADWRFHRHDVHNTDATPAAGPTAEPEVVWEKQLLADRRWSYGYPSPVVVDGTVYVGGDGLFALDAADGSERWHVSTDDDVFGPAVLDGRIYAGANAPDGGAVRAYGRDGSVEWETTLPGNVRTRETVVAGDYVWTPIERPEASASGTLDPGVLLFDRDGGDRLATLSTAADHPFPPAVTDEFAVVNASDALAVRAADPSCGPLCGLLGPDFDERWSAESVRGSPRPSATSGCTSARANRCRRVAAGTTA